MSTVLMLEGIELTPVDLTDEEVWEYLRDEPTHAWNYYAMLRYDGKTVRVAFRDTLKVLAGKEQ